MPSLPIHSIDPGLLARVNNPSTRDAAFGAFYDVFARRVYAYALRMTKCQDGAADITQETFIRVHAHLKRGNTIVDPLPFLLMLARQRMANVRRDHKDTHEVSADDLVVDPYHAIHAADLSTHIGNAVEALPPQLREAFILRYYDGLPYEDIAALLTDKPGAIRMRVLRAKAMLRSALLHIKEAEQ
ncbi:MAG: sigma-70 family RNA polymerase sigma factor [Candidatus Kapabacteria bacterium]|nr:sigma-70 family RNA polymerase sigma factor [Candidatus Kapabacteria bacterium]